MISVPCQFSQFRVEFGAVLLECLVCRSHQYGFGEHPIQCDHTVSPSPSSILQPGYPRHTDLGWQGGLVVNQDHTTSSVMGTWALAILLPAVGMLGLGSGRRLHVRSWDGLRSAMFPGGTTVSYVVLLEALDRALARLCRALQRVPETQDTAPVVLSFGGHPRSER